MVLLRLMVRIPLFCLWTLVFLFQMTIYGFDRLAWKILRYDKKTRYVRMGGCARTGLCCQTLGVELPESWVKRSWIVAFFNRWYAAVHNFQSLGPPQGKLLPLSCGYLRNGKDCSIYPYRPKLCREFPQLTLFGRVRLHKGCGFWFLERAKLGSFDESMQRELHEAGRREYLVSEKRNKQEG